MAAIRGATVQAERSAELFRETHHDMISFTRAIAEQLGPPGRWIHLGLTSSDVLDTALSLQVQEAADILAEDLGKLEAVLSELAVRYKYTLTIGRTHGIHAEPTTFGHKMAVFVAQVRRDCQRLEQARDELRVGKLSGAVGTHANVPAEVEESALQRLGLRPAEAARRSCSATATPVRRDAGGDRAPRSSSRRPRYARCSGPRSAKPSSRFRAASRARARCRTSAIRSCASASAAWRACCAATS